MSNSDHTTNAWLVDHVDEVRNKLLSAHNYAVAHKLQIEPNIEADLNSVCESLLGVSHKLWLCIDLPMHDPHRVDAVKNIQKALERARTVVHAAIASNGATVGMVEKPTTTQEIYAERLRCVLFEISDTVRSLGANDEQANTIQ